MMPGPFPNRMNPSAVHEPPSTARGASQMISTGPPLTFTFFNFPPPQNAMERLSGDQNGGAEFVTSVP